MTTKLESGPQMIPRWNW